MQDFDPDLEDAYLEDEDTQKDKYLTFRLAEEDYAIEIPYVVEIIGIQRITEVPDTTVFLKGVINLRGKIIPVVDVRLRFGMAERPYGERTCIVIVDVAGTMVGLIVDEVSEVMDIPEAQVSPPPKTGKGTQSRYVQSIGRVDEQVKLILNISALLTEAEREAVAQAA